MSNQGKERAEFEEYAESYLILVTSDGKYINPYTKTAYSAWQASAERYQSRIAKLEAEVARVKELFGAISVLANSGAIAYDEGHPECALWSSVEMQALCEAMKGGV